MKSDGLPAGTHCELAIIGAGIAGASVACFASPFASVLLLESEAHPAVHSTGRSAAMFMESYGSPQVRAVTRASRPFFENPPPGFSATPLLAPRGALYIANAAQVDQAHALHAALLAEGCPAQLLSTAQALALVPALNADAAVLAVLDPLAADIDVNALHQGYLRSARVSGAELRCNAEVTKVEACDNGGWWLQTSAGTVRAAMVVNAAGAWADAVAQRAGVATIGLQPCRRSAFVFEAPADMTTAHWPCVAPVDEGWYFKPEAGLLLGSPANADPVPPHDVMPEEIDIATGIANIEAATSLRIRRPRRSWAGLRSFVADGDLVSGYAPGHPGFWWQAALGGYGIQTSAALGALAAARLVGRPRPDWAAAADTVLHTLPPRPPQNPTK